jgi:DeoR family transcriptional regulator, aga operon transcriptional repressor
MSHPRPTRLLAEERRREILRFLDRYGRVTIDDVVVQFSVSAVTARSDLDALSKTGALVRSHGGGVKPLIPAPEYPLAARATMHREQKVRIAQAAVQLIKPFQTVILCSGSTSFELANQLRRVRPEGITIITHALNIASKLADLPNVNMIMVGGILRHAATAFIGPQAEDMMRCLHADHCFLSAVGVDSAVGLTTLDIMEAQLNRCMIESSAEVTAIVDASKFGHRSLSLISNFTRIRRLITVKEAPLPEMEALKALGVEVVLV